MKVNNIIEIAGFRFIIQPIHADLTMNEHFMFDEVYNRWRQAVLLAMLPWIEPAKLRIVTDNGITVPLPVYEVQKSLEAPSATGKMPNGDGRF